MLDDCVHHWRLDTPQAGQPVLGACSKCGLEKPHPTGMPHDAYRRFRLEGRRKFPRPTPGTPVVSPALPAVAPDLPGEAATHRRRWEQIRGRDGQPLPATPAESYL